MAQAEERQGHDPTLSHFNLAKPSRKKTIFGNNVEGDCKNTTHGRKSLASWGWVTTSPAAPTAPKSQAKCLAYGRTFKSQPASTRCDQKNPENPGKLEKVPKRTKRDKEKGRTSPDLSAPRHRNLNR